MDGRTYRRTSETHFIRSTLRSRPKNKNRLFLYVVLLTVCWMLFLIKLLQCRLTDLLVIYNRDVRKPNSGSAKPIRTEAKRSNQKFRFPWLFTKPNLSHTTSQYLSHSHKALTFVTLRTLSDSKWSWNQIISRHHAFETNWAFRKPSTKMQNAHTRKTAYTFFCILQLIYNENRTEPTVFQTLTKTEPNLKNPFRTFLESWYIMYNTVGLS